jgi:serine/threonine protein kinase
MSPDRWPQLKSLVADCLLLPREERIAYLDEACAGDAALRAEAESLLQVYAGDTVKHFMEEPAFAGQSADAGLSTGRDWIGRRIGAYRILSRLGKGSLGEVYRAVRQDGETEQQVALRLVRSGYDTGHVIKRFQAEFPALDALRHPFIARLLEGGVTNEGLPYFVSEVVEGLPIDTYCNDRRLSVAARLALFRDVCDAVQHAHQHLHVHRALKPGNILVLPDGTPRLLDLGLAKMLDPQAAEEAGQSAETVRAAQPLEYASPEQLRGEPITTATDVHALGVVLYQLLTGLRPYGEALAGPDLARAICDTIPERPSVAVGRLQRLALAATTSRGSVFASVREADPKQLARRLDGDLDRIVLLALRKHPQRRYASAEQLGADLQRYLDRMPVLAYPDRFGYHARKFLLRHRWTTGIAAGVLVTLAAILAMAEHSSYRARSELARAERQWKAVRAVPTAFINEVHDAIQPLAGSVPLRKTMVQHALRYMDSLVQQGAGNPPLQREAAAGYERIAVIQGGPAAGHLNDTFGSLASYRKAIALRDALWRAKPADAALLRDLIRLRMVVVNLLRERGQPQTALAEMRAVLPMAEKLVRQTRDPHDRLALASLHMDLSGQLAAVASWRLSLDQTRQAATVLQSVVKDHPDNGAAKRMLAQAYARSAALLGEFGEQHQEAQALLEQSLAMALELLAVDAANADFLSVAAQARLGIGRSLLRQNDPDAALPPLRQAMSGFQTLAAADPTNTNLRLHAATANGAIAEALFHQGELFRTIDHAEMARAGFDSLPKETIAGHATRNLIGMNHYRMGKAFAALSDDVNALPAKRAQYRVLAREALTLAAPLLAEGAKRGDIGQEGVAALADLQGLLRRIDALSRGETVRG